MEDQSAWKAKVALACYFVLIGGTLMASFVVGFVLFGMGIDLQDLPFPIVFISLPVSETIILGVTLLFAKYKGASLKELGLKKVSVRILTVVSVAAVLVLFLSVGISIGQEIVFGPDPMAELLETYTAPKDSFQLVALIALSLVLVGPCEELAFRGFIQKGFENSFGKIKGLLIASVLFGLPHGIDTLYAFFPVFAGSLVLGYVWQQTGGNTTASALMHGVYNTIVTLLAYFATV